MKRSQKILLASILLALASWFVPILVLVTLPLQYLYTHLHEMGHAVAGFLTGGRDIAIVVNGDGSGVTTASGGWPLLVAPAGYLLSTVAGAAILYASRRAEGARTSLMTTSAVLAVALVLWIRGDVVGLCSAGAAILGLWMAGKHLKGEALAMSGQFLGAYLCLASVQAVFDTVGFGMVQVGENDAVILERLTGIPAILSAVAWAGISGFVVIAMLHRAWKDA